MRRYLWYFLVIGAVGCLWAYNAWRRERTYHLSVSWPNLSEETKVGLRVVRKNAPDEVIHEEKVAAGKGLFLKLDKTLPASDLAVQVKTPEGWTDCEIEREEDAKTIRFRLKAGLAFFWIDNLGGKESELVCGDFRIAVPSDSKATGSFPIPLKKAMPIKLGDKDLGEISRLEAKDMFLLDVGYLVDPTGKRKYTHERIVYKGTAGIAPEFNMVGGKDSLEPRHLHRLPTARIDYFLERAPNKLEVVRHGPQIVKEQTIRYQVLRE